MNNTTKTNPSLAFLLLLLAVLILIWAVEWLLIRICNEYIDIYTSTAVRFGIAAAVMAAFMLLFRIPVTFDRESIRLYVVVCIFSFIIPYFFCYWALLYIESALTALIFAVFPIIVAIGAHFFVPGERLTVSKLGGAIIGFVGIALLFIGKMKTPSLAGFWQPKHGVTSAQALLAMLAIVAATFSWAVQAIYVKLKAEGRHPFSFIFPGLLFSTIACAVVSAFHEPASPNIWSLRVRLYILLLAVFATVTAFALYYYLLSKFPVSKISMSAFVTPMVSVILGVTFGREAISRFGWYGIPLVIGGVVLATRPWEAFRTEKNN
ncbi:MAG: DMT family transporter [Planctomycetota bacterium]|nr:MAG: DMT family transporter [Planctomycetota bacterium]